MSDVNTNRQSSTTNDNISMASISGIINMINAAFSVPNVPVTPLPPPLVLTGANLRPGITASDITSRIITRQSEAGLPVGNVFADGDNTAQAMELIRIQEIVNALLTEAKIEIVIPPGITVTTIGVGNLGAPVVSQGITTNLAVGVGVIR